MAYDAMTRRNILKTLTAGIAATSVLRVIPAQAAEHAHNMVAAEQAAPKIKIMKLKVQAEWQRVLC